MIEDDKVGGGSSKHDLSVVTARLTDLQRQCRSVESRNHEATEMAQRIESILGRLAPSDEGDADPIPFRALARELFAVERFFESNGFLSAAKEVAHVERTLEAFAPPDQAEAPIPLVEAADLEIRVKPEPIADAIESDTADHHSKWAVPKPVAVIMVFFVVALAICIVVIVRHNAPAPPVASAEIPPAPLPTSTPRTPPTPSTATSRSPAQPAPGAILAEAVGKARLALADGDVDLAIDELSRAALVDADHATVLGTANQIVDLLVQRAEAAIDGGLWEIADLTLARASRIATRFGLDTHEISEAAHRYSEMARFKIVKPGETAVIRAAAGRRVTVFFKDDSSQESTIKGVEGPYLLLNEDTTVRGGAVYFTDKVPLADIGFLKVWED